MPEGLRDTGIDVRSPVFRPDFEVAMSQRLAAFSLKQPSGQLFPPAAHRQILSHSEQRCSLLGWTYLGGQ